jgi:hypothetical protein
MLSVFSMLWPLLALSSDQEEERWRTPELEDLWGRLVRCTIGQAVIFSFSAMDMFPEVALTEAERVAASFLVRRGWAEWDTAIGGVQGIRITDRGREAYFDAHPYGLIQATLEVRCADDRGVVGRLGYNIKRNWSEDDKACLEDYEETRQKHLALEKAPYFDTNVRRMDTDDRYSLHSDCYIDFELYYLENVISVLKNLGLSGDILDVHGTIGPEYVRKIQDLTGWTVNEELYSAETIVRP